MNDDIRICLKLAHRPIDATELSTNDSKKSPRRVAVAGVRSATVRVRSVRGGQWLVIEGSFNGLVQGHNVVGTMHLRELVRLVVKLVLRRLKIAPSREEQRAIDKGRIKLERLDLVGYLKVNHLGGPSAVVKALDVGLAGSHENRMIFQKETLVYHSHSKHWSLMAYDKAAQLQAKHPEIWEDLDPRVQQIATDYVRFELRQFRRELVRLGWLEVKDVDVDQMKEQFAERLKQLLDDLRRPFPALPLPDDQTTPSVAFMRALLLSYGHDCISGLSERAQRRQWQQLKADYGIGRRNVADLQGRHRRTLKDLQREPCFPIRHGAPRSLKEAGLVAIR